MLVAVGGRQRGGHVGMKQMVRHGRRRCKQHMRARARKGQGGVVEGNRGGGRQRGADSRVYKSWFSEASDVLPCFFECSGVHIPAHLCLALLSQDS